MYVAKASIRQTDSYEACYLPNMQVHINEKYLQYTNVMNRYLLLVQSDRLLFKRFTVSPYMNTLYVKGVHLDTRICN